jgi:hypothetical protein
VPFKLEIKWIIKTIKNTLNTLIQKEYDLMHSIYSRFRRERGKEYKSNDLLAACYADTFLFTVN